MERKLIEDKARIIVDTAFLKDGVVEKMQALERFDRTTFIHSLNVAGLIERYSAASSTEIHFSLIAIFIVFPP